MSTWNHRIIVRFDSNGNHYYGFHEIHYKTNGKIEGWTENPVPLIGDTVHEIREAARKMYDASEHDVLIEKKVRGKLTLVPWHFTEGKPKTRKRKNV